VATLAEGACTAQAVFRVAKDAIMRPAPLMLYRNTERNNVGHIAAVDPKFLLIANLHILLLLVLQRRLIQSYSSPLSGCLR